jgi:hypothetical protein
LVVLAHLRRRWSLSGREGLGSSLPPAELARRDSALFGEVNCLFSTAPEVGKETEMNGGHRGDRTLHRTRSWYDRTRPISSTQRGYVIGRWSGLTSHPVSSPVRRRSERVTGASGPSRNRRVRSCVQRGRAQRSDDRTRGTSGYVRSDASGR